MKIETVIEAIEKFAPLVLQESYDNAGLQVGDFQAEARGALLCIDVTENVIDEAISKNLNLIISHHPLIFNGLKHLTGNTYVERCVAKAIRYNLNIYAAHTNVDSVIGGVSGRMAQKLDLQNIQILQVTENLNVGFGVAGNLKQEISEKDFLQNVKQIFGCSCVRHTNFLGKKIKKVALCGGAGSFLLKNAIAANADIFVSADFKYHEFFGAENRILIADIGHYESEVFTKEIFYEIITKKFPIFAAQISETEKNQINYL